MLLTERMALEKAHSIIKESRKNVEMTEHRLRAERVPHRPDCTGTAGASRRAAGGSEARRNGSAAPQRGAAQPPHLADRGSGLHRRHVRSGEAVPAGRRDCHRRAVLGSLFPGDPEAVSGKYLCDGARFGIYRNRPAARPVPGGKALVCDHGRRALSAGVQLPVSANPCHRILRHPGD